MTAPESPHAVTARATVTAIRACEEAVAAIDHAMATANARSVVVHGWLHLQQAKNGLLAVIDPHSPVRIVAENEVRAGGTS